MTTDLSHLNEQQAEAVTSESSRLLLLAGAGSGKTKTLLQKLIYLIEEKEVNSSNILAITFTRNAANEMVDRLIDSADDTGDYLKGLDSKRLSAKERQQLRYEHSQQFKWIKNLTVRTFHSLCYKILRDDGVNEFDNRFKIINEKKNTDPEFAQFSAGVTSYEVLHKILIELSGSNTYLLRLKRYILDFLVDKVHLRDAPQRSPYQEGRRYTSLNGTRVRSKSEQYIADWLYRHNIKFRYEPTINLIDFDFHPDFYIPEADLYLEHKSNLSAPSFAKERQFRRANKTFIITYETMAKDSVLFNLALDRIIKERLPANYNEQVALSFEEEFRTYHREVHNFLRQLVRVINMIKVDDLTLEAVRESAQTDQHERVREFYELSIPIVQKYLAYCIDKSYLDFNDMISRTISLFQNHPEVAKKYREKYKYILVDEFQDVNSLQVRLLHELLTSDNQLFCVGDDWQSIYGFQGSNVDYVINFKQYFPDGEIMKLSLNYRSTDLIVGASNEVIKHNLHRLDKEVQSTKVSANKIHVYSGHGEEDNIDYAVAEIRRLQDHGYGKYDILFLYRRSKMYEEYFDRFRSEGLYVTGKTIHSAKGLEAKAVFIIGLTEGPGGFPDIWMEDRIFQVIRETRHDLLLEEERRLFYVAVTRAKEDLYLLTERSNESSFVREIPAVYKTTHSQPLTPVVDEVKLCSNCKKQVDLDSKFCKHCGAMVGTS